MKPAPVLTFTIAQEAIKPELDRVFNKVKKNINLPGFRKDICHAPFSTKNLVKKPFTKMCSTPLPAAYEAAVKEAGLEVVAQPKIDVASLEKVKTVINAEVVTKPEVELGDYKTLEVSVAVSKK